MSAYPLHELRATSLTILGVLAVSAEPSIKARALWMRHAHTACHYPRTDPADASAAWRRSPQMAPEPQPHAGALAGAAAGTAGRAVQARHAAAAAALSHAPGIDAGRSTRAACLAWAASHIATCRDRRRHSQTTPPHGATRRGRRRRGKSGGPPRPRGADTAAARRPFQRANHPGDSFRGALNLFLPVQT